jgi:2-phospho-L-lactate guanylyltransferase
MCADLPCLTAADLEDALAEGPGSHRFVADASGAGTTLYTAPHEAFVPEFGFRSAALHLESGARPIAGDLPRLRRDVDDAADLTDAIRLGVGAHTAVVVAGLPAEIT